MPSIPEPRDRAEHYAPRCLRHHVHLASCADCQAEMHAAREQAAKRLDRAAR